MACDRVSKNQFRRLHSRVRQYFNDAVGAGFDRTMNNVLAAAERVGVSESTAKALWAKCFDPSIEPNGKMLSFHEQLDCCLNPD